MKRKQRHLGRELALQWLFLIDVGHQSIDETLADVPYGIEEIGEEGIEFARTLVRGMMNDQARIDETILKYARGWPLSRLAGVERNVLRIALYEIMDMPDIPPSVSIDEAVEVAKKYGTEESGKFVNGILGAYMRGEFEPPAKA